MPHSATWSQWSINSDALIVLIVAATVAYVWPRRRILVAPWWLGSIFAAVLFCSPIHQLSMSSYPAHMTEHLLIVLVIAPLIVIGSNPRGATPPVSVIGFFAYIILIPLYHLTKLGGVIMRSTGAHSVELIVFFFVGIMFWWGPLGGVFNRIQRLAYVAMSIPVSIFTGLALMGASRPPFPLDPMSTKPNPLEDLHRGGVVMATLSLLLLAVHLVASLVQPKSTALESHETLA